MPHTHDSAVLGFGLQVVRHSTGETSRLGVVGDIRARVGVGVTGKQLLLTVGSQSGNGNDCLLVPQTGLWWIW